MLSRALAIAALGVALTAGCGGGAKVSTTTAASAPASGAATTTSLGATGSTTTTTGADGTSTTATFSGAGSDRYCEVARQIKALEVAGGSDSTDLKRQVGLLRQAIPQLLPVVPPEIKEDWQLYLPYVEAFLKAIEDAGYDESKVDSAKFDALNTPEVQVAGERVQRYDKEICGVS